MPDQEPVVMSAGKRTSFIPGNFASNSAPNSEENNAGGVDDNANTGQSQEEIDAAAKLAGNNGAAAGGEGEAALPEFTDEQRAAFLKSINFEGSIDDLKTKLQPVTADPTAEQLALKEKELEKRMLDLYVEKLGGKVEDFVAAKQLSVADVVEVSKETLKKELLDNGFDEEDSKVIAKQLSLEADLENLEQGEDESEADFTKRKEKLKKQVEYGAKKMADVGNPIIQKAKGVLDYLKQQIEAQDAEKAEEVELQSTIDTHIKTVPKEFKIELGTVNDKPVEPFSMKVPEEAILKVSAQLKDPKQRDALFYDDKGKLNIPFLTDLLLAKELYQSAAKSSYTEGQTRQVAIIKAQFGKSAHEVGVGGAPNREVNKNVPASTGKVQRVQPQR